MEGELMKMKRMICVVFAMCFFLVGCLGNDSSKNEKDDYKAIQTLTDELRSLSSTSLMSTVGDNGSWNIFELGLMYEKDDEFFKRLRSDLGDDFHWKLSNGDSLFIGILPHRKSFRIYAGTPDESHMIYPDWNYDRLKKK